MILCPWHPGYREAWIEYANARLQRAVKEREQEPQQWWNQQDQDTHWIESSLN